MLRKFLNRKNNCPPKYRATLKSICFKPVFFFVFCSMNLFSQTGIKGIIVDSAALPVPFVSVALLSATDSSIKSGNLANDLGEYIFENVKQGDYLVKAMVVGYEVGYSSLIKIDSSGIFSVPTLKLKPSAVTLKEISVVAIKRSVEFKDGIITLNVENSPLASGNTVFDLLKRLPGVYVDNQNNVFLNGRAGVRIMIDGKIQRISGSQLVAILNGMSAEAVSKIEVMNNPPSKYDAEGTGGMINIMTKKVKLVGFSGNVSGGIGKGIAYRGSTDASLNYKGKNFTIFSNFGYGNRVFYNNYIFNKTITYNGNTTHLNELGVQVNTQQVIYYKLGADFNLSDRTIIGFFINGGPASTPFTDIGVNQVSGYNNLGYDHTPFNVSVTDKWSNPGYNINAEHQFDSLGTKLNFSADYSNYSGKRSALSLNPFLDVNNVAILPENDYLSTSITDINIFTQKLDFQKNIGKSLTLETGVKATFVDSKNEYSLTRKNVTTGVFEEDTNYTDKYAYKENIYAGYINFKQRFKSSTLQVGGRGENTIVEANNQHSGFKLTRNYFYFFPNFSIDYSPSNKHYFLLNVTRRIDRPGYKELNPYKSYQDNYSFTTGNPYLLPQTVYNASLTYSFNNILHNTFTYSRFSDLMLSFDFQNDSTKETISTIRNITGSNYFSYTLFMQRKLKSWMNLTFSGTGFYQDYVGNINGSDINRSAFSYTGFLSNEFLLPKNFKLQLSGMYVGPSVYGIKNIHSRWSLDIGVKKTFLKDKLVLSVAFFDIFYKNVFSVSSKFLNQDFVFINPSDTRRLWLNVSYKFGKIKVQKKVNNSNEQEKGRFEDKLKK